MQLSSGHVPPVVAVVGADKQPSIARLLHYSREMFYGADGVFLEERIVVNGALDLLSASPEDLSAREAGGLVGHEIG